jgi:hypothetical protein
MKLYGTCVEIPTVSSSVGTSNASHVESNASHVDFWSEHENEESLVPKTNVSSNSIKNNEKLNKQELSNSQKTSPVANRAALSTAGPNVSLAHTSDQSNKDYRPSLIGSKRSTAKKGVNINFDLIINSQDVCI